MGKILLIRHGQASVLSDNYDQLSDIGRVQGARLAAYFQTKNLNPHKIISGPLERQKDTAHLAFSSHLENGANVEIMDQLREHEGYQIVKSVIPQLIQEDPVIRKIASEDMGDRQSRIKCYMRMYEVIAKRWIKEELDYDTTRFESWKDFKSRVATAMELLKERSIANHTTVVVSSGGPISVLISQILGLSDEKSMHLSWALNNASISELLFNDTRISLKSFNTLPHLQEDELITLV